MPAFFFDTAGKNVAVVEKKKFPKGYNWSANPLNAIGGKIEEDEEPFEAMVREFKEETGVEIRSWQWYLTYELPFGIVFFYRAFDNAILNVKTMEAEPIHIVPANATDRMIPNLRWILPLALDEKIVVGQGKNCIFTEG